MKLFKISDVFMTPEKLKELKHNELNVDYSLTDTSSTEFIELSKNFLLDTLHGKDSN